MEVRISEACPASFCVGNERLLVLEIWLDLSKGSGSKFPLICVLKKPESPPVCVNCDVQNALGQEGSPGCVGKEPLQSVLASLPASRPVLHDEFVFPSKETVVVTQSGRSHSY